MSNRVENGTDKPSSNREIPCSLSTNERQEPIFHQEGIKVLGLAFSPWLATRERITVNSKSWKS